MSTVCSWTLEPHLDVPTGTCTELLCPPPKCTGPKRGNPLGVCTRLHFSVPQNAGIWSPEGTWLSAVAASEPLTCYTTHLTSFSVQPLVNVEAVSGCGVSTGPAALFCPPDAAAITVAGGNFGDSGVQVLLLQSPKGGGAVARWRCPSVHHIVGSEDSRVVCLQPQAPAGAKAAVQWVDVQVVVQCSRRVPSPALLATLYY